ncbi:MAG: Crp/Fnr family transcriptional regulator [Sphingobacteriales bacterium]|jgi:CRP-like cAMP-binding protein|nr:MAG: Crp/Fnr family transcriptional regulator [Sphingobacteriales bacterium]
MNQISFITYLASKLNIDEERILSIQQNCIVKEYKKDEFLLRSNEYCKHIFFVEKGLLRQYSIDSKGKEHILHFAPESWLLADRESTFFNQPSKYYIQALEDTRVTMIDDVSFKKMEEDIPNFSDFNQRMLHNNIRSLQNRIMMLLSENAEERYLQFTTTYPDVLLRVPQLMVASYLGITPESLSRVRKELANKNMNR